METTTEATVSEVVIDDQGREVTVRRPMTAIEQAQLRKAIAEAEIAEREARLLAWIASEEYDSVYAAYLEARSRGGVFGVNERRTAIGEALSSIPSRFHAPIAATLTRPLVSRRKLAEFLSRRSLEVD